MSKAIRFLFVAAILAIIIRLALPVAGTFLVAVDPPRKADAIVVLGSSMIERALEAGSLYREGVAPLIVLSHPEDAGLQQLYRHLQVQLPTQFEQQRSALLQMGVPAAALAELPGRPRDTRDEAALIRRLAADHGLKTIVVVTSNYHSRRAGLYIRRTAAGRYTIAMRGTRYERIDPHVWWRRPYDRIDVLLEWVKLPKYLWSLRSM